MYLLCILPFVLFVHVLVKSLQRPNSYQYLQPVLVSFTYWTLCKQLLTQLVPHVITNLIVLVLLGMEDIVV